jgi:hypothetical protein
MPLLNRAVCKILQLILGVADSQQLVTYQRGYSSRLERLKQALRTMINCHLTYKTILALPSFRLVDLTTTTLIF